MTTNPRPDQGWALQIEGVAAVPVHGQPFDDPGGDFEFFQVMLESGGNSSDSITPENAGLSTSAMTFVVSATDEMRRLWLFQQTIPPFALVEAIDEQDTQIEVVSIGPGDIEVGDIIYLGGEAMRVDANPAAGIFDVTRGDDLPYLTRSQPHGVAAEVYTRVPRWRGRLVQLFLVDGGDTVQKWRGYVESPKLSDDGTRIIVTCKNAWTAAIGTSLNRTSVSSGELTLVVDPVSSGFRLLSQSFEYTEGPRFSGRRSFYGRVKDFLVSAFDKPFTDSVLLQGTGGIVPLLGSGRDYEVPEEREFIPAKFRGVFLVSPLADEEVGFVASTLHPGDVPYYAHPLQIAAFHLTGVIFDEDGNASYPIETGDFIGEQWSAQLRGVFADDFEDDVFQLIREDIDLQVDHYLLGWDGEEIDLLAAVQQKLLRPYGYIFGVKDTGEPTINRFGFITPQDAIEVETEGRIIKALPSPWKGALELALGSSTDIITASVGVLPWDDGVSVTLTARGGDANRSRLGDKGQWTLDYSTLSTDRVQEVQQRIISRSAFAAFALPRISVRAGVEDVEGIYDLGQVVRLDLLPTQDPYLIGPDGEITRELGDDRRYGIIIQRTFDQFRRVYDLTILLTSYRTGFFRLRAPSAIVEDVTDLGGDEYELRLDDPFSTLDGVGDSFLINGDAGAIVYFFDENFSLQHSSAISPTIRSTSDDEVVVLTTYVPQPGDIMRLATYDDNIGPSSVGGFLLWNFMADDETREFPDNQDPHIYS